MTLVTSRELEASARQLDSPLSINRDLAEPLERRFGRRFCRQRLGIEDEHEARAGRRSPRGRRTRAWYFSPAIVRRSLKLTGLYWRARRNAERIELRRHRAMLPGLPAGFNDFTILQISDLHVDLNPGAMRRLCELLPRLSCDLCVLTGDYRGRTFGPWRATIDGMAQIRASITAPVYGILGNHDSLRMVPPLEEMGIHMLVNEAAPLLRRGERVYLAGIDDAHFYRMDNIEKAAAQIPDGAFSILLSHTPEIYRQAAHAGFELMLSGHTHGGQICLPGAVPLTLDSVLPRRMGSGAWHYGAMVGYTSAGVGASIVPARINCPPEITLHQLQAVPTDLPRYACPAQHAGLF